MALYRIGAPEGFIIEKNFNKNKKNKISIKSRLDQIGQNFSNIEVDDNEFKEFLLKFIKKM